MKKVIIFHGTGENTQSYWYPYLKTNLEEKGYQVITAELPDTNHPDLATWLPKALEEQYTKDTIVIGHSAGSTLILALLEKLTVKIKQAILVAAFYQDLPEFAEPIIKSSYDWKKIQASIEDIIIVNSDNDSWGCTAEVGQDMINKIGGTLVIPHNQGHMGSDSFNQPYKEFPLLLKLID